jgi:hypothetical protein
MTDNFGLLHELKVLQLNEGFEKSRFVTTILSSGIDMSSLSNLLEMLDSKAKLDQSLSDILQTSSECNSTKNCQNMLLTLQQTGIRFGFCNILCIKVLILFISLCFRICIFSSASECD